MSSSKRALLVLAILSALAWPLGAQTRLRLISAVSTSNYVVYDTYTDTAGDDLGTQHTGEVGATWTENAAASGGSAVVTDENRVRLATATADENYVASGIPSSACYDVEADWHVKSEPAGNFYSILGRFDASTANGYFAMRDVPDQSWGLFKKVDGVNSQLGSRFADTVTVGETIHIKLEIRANAKKLFLRGIERVSSTDDSITAVGRAGFGGFLTSEADTNLAGFHLDNFVVTNYTGDCDPVIDPPEGIEIFPGTSIQTVVNANPDGTAFVLKTGTHRQQSVTPKNGNTFSGETGTILEGSRVISGWTASGGRWYKAGQTDNVAVDANQYCYTNLSNRCGHNQELFLNHVRQKHENELTLVGAGEWFFDYPADTMWVGSDPTSATVTFSDTIYAFTGTNDDVILQGFTIREYSNGSQTGCLNAVGAERWIVRRVTVTNCHSLNIRLGTGMLIQDSVISYAGALGIGGGGSNIVLEYSEVHHNNGAYHAPGFEAGGSKFAGCNGCRASYNYFHDNDGPGIWFDINNDNYIIEYNTTDDNHVSNDINGIDTNSQSPGIMVEVSYGGVIRYNLSRRNGTGYAIAVNFGYPACILIASSGSTNGIDIHHNVCEDNVSGISLVEGPRDTDAYNHNGIDDEGNCNGIVPPAAATWRCWVFNVNVHDNVIASNTNGYAGGGGFPDGGTGGVTNQNNVFTNNVWYTGGGTGECWAWNSQSCLVFSQFDSVFPTSTEQNYSAYTHTPAGANGAGVRP